MTTEKREIGRCSIYEDRPKECGEYPLLDSYIPEECTYYFVGNERRGDCACDVAACCSMPRDGGEPTARHLPEIAGGKPCKHLVFVEEERPGEKTASSCFGCASDPRSEEDIYQLVGGPDE